MARTRAAPAVVNIPDAELANIAAAHGDTKIETNTIVEDNTNAPSQDVAVEYESEDVELTPGTVLTTYGSPVGGFAGEPEAAE